MNTINITKQNAIKAWHTANADMKKVLEDLFGAEVITAKEIPEHINTWEDILWITGASANDYQLRPGETDDELAYRQAKLIAFAYNGNKVTSLSQTRYYPWGELKNNDQHPSGFALSCLGYVYWFTNSTVGVRLCFSNPDHPEDAFKKFKSIYERLQIF
jgi:hypothetical protein